MQLHRLPIAHDRRRVNSDLRHIAKPRPELPPLIILRLRNMTAIDSTGLQALEKFADRVHESGRQLILCGARQQPEMRMHDAEFHEHVGEENICHSVADALDRAKIVYPEVAKQIPTGPPGAEEVPMNRGGGHGISESPHLARGIETG